MLGGSGACRTSTGHNNSLWSLQDRKNNIKIKTISYVLSVVCVVWFCFLVVSFVSVLWFYIVDIFSSRFCNSSVLCFAFKYRPNAHLKEYERNSNWNWNKGNTLWDTRVTETIMELMLNPLARSKHWSQDEFQTESPELQALFSELYMSFADSRDAHHSIVSSFSI